MASDEGLRIAAESQRQSTEAQGRLFVPGQQAVVHLNEEFYERYVANDPRLPDRFKAGLRVFNDLLPYSRYRPVTPVGQKLWNAQVRAMEAALYGENPQVALDEQTLPPHGVQKDLDRFFAEKHGPVIRSWHWFFWLYGLLIAAAAGCVYAWDTSERFRTALGRLMPWRSRGPIALIEGARGGPTRARWKEGLICASPWLIGFVVFSGGPMLFSMVMSLCDYDVINAPRLIGLENYVRMPSDRLFWYSLYNTVFMVLGIPIGIAASLAVALLLNLSIKGVAVWRTFFYLPAIVPMVAASVLWIWIFNPENGLINLGLELFGIDGPKWLQDASWSKPAIILMGLWGAGASMIIWLAGLKGISPALYEAASVDGANVWQRFWNITIPQLTPYVFFNLIMALIGTFQIFGQAFIMTQGGPADSTLFYVYYLFNNAFRYGEMGYASALAWSLFVIVLILTIVQLRLSKRWVHYEAE
jgi:multiple sugar transport system permease protein